jgi:hypothetical protein
MRKIHERSFDCTIGKTYETDEIDSKEIFQEVGLLLNFLQNPHAMSHFIGI